MNHSKAFKLFLSFTACLASIGQTVVSKENSSHKEKKTHPSFMGFFSSLPGAMLAWKIQSSYGERAINTLYDDQKDEKYTGQDVLKNINNLEKTLKDKLGGHWTVQPFSDGKLLAGLFISDDKGNVIINYPGTAHDGEKNANIKLASFGSSSAPFHAHQGFLEVFKRSWKSVDALLVKYMKKHPGNINVLTSGFSRGGASANIAALMIASKHKNTTLRIITFGAPAVFDEKTAKKLEGLIHRNHIYRFALTDCKIQHNGKTLKTQDRVPLLTSNKLMPYVHSGLKIHLSYLMDEEDYPRFQKVSKSPLGAHGFYGLALDQLFFSSENANQDFMTMIEKEAGQTKKVGLAKRVISAPGKQILKALGKKHKDE